MEKDVYISIRSIYDCTSDKREIMDFATDGVFSWEGDRGRLSYYESAVTGMDGTKTTMDILPDSLAVNRKGTVCSDMRFKVGHKDTVFYTTPYGTANLGIDTRSIRTNVGNRGGNITIDYVVSMDHIVSMKNKFILDIREQGDKTGV